MYAEVKLSTKGEAHVKWSQQENETDSNGNTCSRTVYYTNKEVYFHVAYPILERSQGCRSSAKINSTLIYQSIFDNSTFSQGYTRVYECIACKSIGN